MNTNIVIPTLHLFQILPKFQEESSRLMTVSPKPCKKEIVPSAISIKEKEDINYADIYQPGKNVNTNHALLQTPK